MSAADDELLSPRNLVVLGGLLLLAVVIGEVVIGPDPGEQMAAEKPVDTIEDIAGRIGPVVSLADMRSRINTASAGGADVAKSPDQLYQAACLACHTTGAAGAPKIGDTAAWAERVGKGLDTLVTSAINGIGAMPPRGGSQYSDEQIKAVVEYILAESQ